MKIIQSWKFLLTKHVFCIYWNLFWGFYSTLYSSYCFVMSAVTKLWKYSCCKVLRSRVSVEGTIFNVVAASILVTALYRNCFFIVVLCYCLGPTVMLAVCGHLPVIKGCTRHLRQPCQLVCGVAGTTTDRPGHVWGWGDGRWVRHAELGLVVGDAGVV